MCVVYEEEEKEKKGESPLPLCMHCVCIYFLMVRMNPVSIVSVICVCIYFYERGAACRGYLMVMIEESHLFLYWWCLYMEKNSQKKKKE